MWQVFSTKNPVVHNKNFMLLLLGKLVSDVGNWVYLLSIVFFISSKTKSAFAVAIILFCNTVPSILFSAISGSVCDRYSKRNVLVISDLVSGFLTLYLGVKSLLVSISVVEVCIIAFLLGISKTFFNPALKSAIPEIIDKDQLNRANSLLQLTRSITEILGPICGGVLIALIGCPVAFIIDGISFILSAISEMFIYIPYTKADNSKIHFKNVYNDAKSGFKFIRTNAIICSLIFVFAIMTFFVSPILLVLKELVEKYYNMGAIGLSIIMISDPVGVLLAGIYLIFRPVVKRQRELVALFPLFCGIALIVMGNVKIFYVAVAAMLVQGFISGFGEISMMTIFQKEIPSDKRGMVFSLSNMLLSVLTPFSFLVWGFVIDKLSLAMILSLCGFVLILGSLLLFSNLVFNKKGKVTQSQ